MANSKNSEYVCNHIKKRKKDLISLFSSKCCICGFNKFQEALEFHHINPEDKEFGITDSNAVTKSLEKQLLEVKKCILLCSNCHKGVHNGYIDLSQYDLIFIDEQKAQELIEENLLIRKGQIHYCERCGKKISKDAKHCVDCANLISRKVDRPSREELKVLIRTKPFTQIAKDYCVTDNAIRKWCIGYGLPSKKKEIKIINDQDWFKI